MEKIIGKIYTQAKILGACNLLTGEEKTIDELVQKFLSPKGLDFCINKHFPHITTFRYFKKYDLRKFGIFLDAGVVELKNPKKVVIIGHTSATITCSTPERHEIFLLHGAKAIVNASNWSVAVTEVETGCCIIKNTSGNSIII